MPKTYGVKDKDRAAAYIVDQLLNGKLRSGDRVDRADIAASLGMSRVPVQEAIVQLERDGLLTSRYHRGVFAEEFDAESVREHHHVYGLLSGEVAGRAALNPTPRVLKELKELMQRMRAETDPAEFENLVWAFRRVLNHEYAGPRLRAGIRSFQTFMPTLFWLAGGENRTSMLAEYEVEFRAIRRGDAEAARSACIHRALRMADIAIGELVRRGVLTEDERTEPAPAPTSGRARRAVAAR